MTGPYLQLIRDDGTRSKVRLNPAPGVSRPVGPLRSRMVYAAAHVIPVAWADNTPGQDAELDWDATLAFRRHLYSWGLGVADAMDTAQRNMGLNPAATRELIARSAAVAKEESGCLAVGVNTDDVTETVIPLRQVIDAYKAQLHYAEDHGVIPVVMASRHLARRASNADDYRQVYREVLRAASAPVILHWLGESFDPELAGYFTGPDESDGEVSGWERASGVLLEIIHEEPSKVFGVKMSLLNASAEVAVRAQLPEGVRMFTGDDFNYVDLILGDSEGHSDALLGAFAALSPLASAAIGSLDAGDTDEYLRLLRPTQELSRHIFAPPTYHYKTGVAFLAWLNGYQPAFQMVGGLHAFRSLPHLSRIVELANKVGALEQPELAAQRWHALLQLNGVDT